MSQAKSLHTALKRALRERGHTYADAARALGISEASVKRLFSRATLSLTRLERLCDWLGMDLADLVSMSAQNQPLLTQLSQPQERALLAEPALLLLTYLVLNRWSQAEIVEVFRFDKPELFRHLAKLEKLGLLELHPFDRIRIRAARNFSWRKDGPIQRFFSERVLREFLDTRFDAPGEKMLFVGGMLSRASILRMHALMEDLAKDFDRMVADDLHLPASERYGVSLFLGERPWEFSEFTRLRRKPARKTFSE